MIGAINECSMLLIIWTREKHPNAKLESDHCEYESEISEV